MGTYPCHHPAVGCCHHSVMLGNQHEATAARAATAATVIKFCFNDKIPSVVDGTENKIPYHFGPHTVLRACEQNGMGGVQINPSQ